MADGLANWILRATLDGAGLLAIGLGSHIALGVVERSAAGLWRRWLLFLAEATLVLAALRFAQLLFEMDPSAPFDPGLIQLGWSVLGLSSLCLGGGACLIALGALTGWRLLLLVGVLGVSASFGLTGHSQGLAQPVPAQTAVALHVALAGFWVAAPLTLFPRSSLAPEALHKRLERFSAIAIAAVPLLIVLGIWLAWSIAGGVEALYSTPYGRLLLFKLGAAVAAFTLGAINQRVLTERVRRDPGTGRALLGRSLLVEALLFAAIVLAIAAATTVAPPQEIMAAV